LPWKETSPVRERKQLIDAYRAREDTLSELCPRFGVSRKTGHKWVTRFLEGCELEDRSSRPHHSPCAVAEWLEDAIVRARKQKPRWGAPLDAAQYSAALACQGAQRSVVRGLQRSLRCRHHALLSADRYGCLQSLSARLRLR